MRGGMIANGLVLAAVALGTAQFASGGSNGSFSGRNAAEWQQLSLSGPSAITLFARGCDTEQCVLRLQLPRERWFALESACVAGARDLCFSGPRLDYRVELGRPLDAKTALWITLVSRNRSTEALMAGVRN